MGDFQFIKRIKIGFTCYEAVRKKKEGFELSNTRGREKATTSMSE